MPAIWSLRPNVSRDQAVAEFTTQGLPLLAPLLRGPLHSTAALYIPFGIFQVAIDTGAGSDAAIFGIDLVRGDFDLYRFDRLPGPESLAQVETRSAPPAVLDAAAAQELLIMRVRRLVFSRGFFRVRALRLKAEAVRMDLHVPYWVGVWRQRDQAHIRVLDAVRRRPEGAKVRNFVRDWLRAPS